MADEDWRALVPVLRSIEARGPGEYWVVLVDPDGGEQAGLFTVTHDGRHTWPRVWTNDDILFVDWPGDAETLRSVIFAISAFDRAGGRSAPLLTGDLTCMRCSRPVTVSAEHYARFRRMHYVCFHYDREHGSTDVDADCGAEGCPSAAVARG